MKIENNWHSILMRRKITFSIIFCLIYFFLLNASFFEEKFKTEFFLNKKFIVQAILYENIFNFFFLPQIFTITVFEK